jgi:hypothetical protein
VELKPELVIPAMAHGVVGALVRLQLLLILPVMAVLVLDQLQQPMPVVKQILAVPALFNVTAVAVVLLAQLLLILPVMAVLVLDQLQRQILAVIPILAAPVPYNVMVHVVAQQVQHLLNGRIMAPLAMRYLRLQMLAGKLIMGLTALTYVMVVPIVVWGPAVMR